MSVPREFRGHVSNEIGTIPGEIKCLTADRSGTMGTFYTNKGVTSGSVYTSVAEAEDSLVTGRNDVILVSPESHAWRGDANATATALTWDKSNTHMLGLDPGGLGGYSRARFSHSGYTMANFMTISGNQNLFKKLRFMHGSATGGASDVAILTVSGDGNRIEDCGLATPLNATQAASANYRGLVVSGAMNHFKNLIIGTENDIDRSGASSLINFTASCGTWNIFENCVFRSRSGGGQGSAYFIIDAVTDTVVDYTALFLNCQFIHAGGTLTLGISKAANTARSLYFDNRCTFVNVTDIVADARNAEVVWGAAGSSPDGSALNDKLYLGIGQTPIHTA